MPPFRKNQRNKGLEHLIFVCSFVFISFLMDIPHLPRYIFKRFVFNVFLIEIELHHILPDSSPSQGKALLPQMPLMTHLSSVYINI